MYSTNRIKRLLVLIFFVSVFIYVVIQVHLYRMTILEGWDGTVSRDISEYIYPNVSTTLLWPENLCQSPAYLMTIVCSAPANFEARNAIRETWGFERNISKAVIVKVYFLLGQTFNISLQHQIQRESEQFNDIIQENFIDTYNNLTLKSVMLLKLVKNDCRNTINYVMKTDDDMFVNLTRLVKSLLTQNATRNVLFGHLICGTKPIRDFYDKWYAPEYMYPGKIYPNYLSGTGYVMSVDVAEKLFDTALQTPLLHLEDVYLTGICAQIAKLRPRHNKNFFFAKIPFNPCKYQTLITTHIFTPTEIRQVYSRIQNTNLDDECKVYKEAVKRNETKTTIKFKKRIRKSKNLCY